MYSQTETSIIFGEKVKYSFIFDGGSLIDLVSSTIIAVNRSIASFKRSKDKKRNGEIIALKMSGDKLVCQIGVYVELIEKVVFLSIQAENLGIKKFKLDDDLKQEIKTLFIKIDNLIGKIGQNNSDFVMMWTTQRARPTKEAMKFIQENW